MQDLPHQSPTLLTQTSPGSQCLKFSIARSKKVPVHDLQCPTATAAGGQSAGKGSNLREVKQTQNIKPSSYVRAQAYMLLRQQQGIERESPLVLARTQLFPFEVEDPKPLQVLLPPSSQARSEVDH